MSDTPKTDAEVWLARDYCGSLESIPVVWPEFARDLERQNAELLKALKIAKENIQWWLDNHGCCAGAEIGAMQIVNAAIAKAEGK